MQIGPGVEVSMRNRMIESQLEVSNRMLQSAAASRQVKYGSLAKLRASLGTRVASFGQQLAGTQRGSRAGDSAAAMRVG